MEYLNSLFETLFNTTLPILIKIFELMGIIILVIGVFSAFYKYIKDLKSKEKTSIKYDLANSLVTALDFKLAAEILKTVIIQSMSELVLVGTIFILRVVMTFVLEREIKIEESEKKSQSKMIDSK
ncbi:MAG: DUF1622 domain-containing protein [Clostridium sp.]|uniref:DUF1622 domain-containing protein n=1 Tax=Clostridium culturomicium TaxID=1499683 RepID=UPI0005907F0E|nr:DUF1622 domain-containing protein [Clostridium culturomicium]MDU4889827.1 DUF1622 domain-containing protein [Clostridium sp.]MDU7083534.1 DUF1622 domain-containing protein [Clostridium sp.]